jgi:hypothetical protein
MKENLEENIPFTENLELPRKKKDRGLTFVKNKK